jgi:ribosome recycling factor
MDKELLERLDSDMTKSLDSLKREFSRVRTGRASISLLDGVQVDYYGTLTPLNQTATLSVPEPRLITIQPWDPKIMADIEKAIQKSDLGLTPINDGKMIRISIPPLTEERRKELVKIIKKIEENCKISIRNHRKEMNDTLKQLKQDKQLAEDNFFKAQKEVQEVTDKFIANCEELTEAKEKEILEF